MPRFGTRVLTAEVHSCHDRLGFRLPRRAALDGGGGPPAAGTQAVCPAHAAHGGDQGHRLRHGPHAGPLPQPRDRRTGLQEGRPAAGARPGLLALAAGAGLRPGLRGAGSGAGRPARQPAEAQPGAAGGAGLPRQPGPGAAGAGGHLRPPPPVHGGQGLPQHRHPLRDPREPPLRADGGRPRWRPPEGRELPPALPGRALGHRHRPPQRRDEDRDPGAPGLLHPPGSPAGPGPGSPQALGQEAVPAHQQRVELHGWRAGAPARQPG